MPRHDPAPRLSEPEAPNQWGARRCSEGQALASFGPKRAKVDPPPARRV